MTQGNGWGRQDPAQIVRVRFLLADGTHAWTEKMRRSDAEQHLSSAEWLCLPEWQGQRVLSSDVISFGPD